jgi:hypothetical protein
LVLTPRSSPSLPFSLSALCDTNRFLFHSSSASWGFSTASNPYHAPSVSIVSTDLGILYRLCSASSLYELHKKIDAAVPYRRPLPPSPHQPSSSSESEDEGPLKSPTRGRNRRRAVVSDSEEEEEEVKSEETAETSSEDEIEYVARGISPEL